MKEFYHILFFYVVDVVHPDMNFCPRVLKGLCGPCLDSCSFKTCEEEFNSRYKGAQPRSCRCDTTGNTHMCSCWIRCGLEDDKMVSNQG